MKIALISDTHLAARAGDFVANTRAAIDWINGAAVDLVIHLGDVTANGIVRPQEIEEARAVLDAIVPPLLCVPGNHDVGDNPVPDLPPPGSPLSALALARFREIFGPDRWVRDVGGWALIGLNAQLFNTGGDEEKGQFDWLHTTLAELRRPIGLFLHKPWFRHSLRDDERHSRHVPREQRLALAELFEGHALRFVASGHTHQLRRLHVGGTEHFWVPSTSFVVPDAMQEWIGDKVVGAALLTLDGDNYALDFQYVAGARHQNLADYRSVFPEVGAILQ